MILIFFKKNRWEFIFTSFIHTFVIYQPLVCLFLYSDNTFWWKSYCTTLSSLVVLDSKQEKLSEEVWHGRDRCMANKKLLVNLSSFEILSCVDIYVEVWHGLDRYVANKKLLVNLTSFEMLSCVDIYIHL